MSKPPAGGRPPRWALLVLWALILLFSAYFSAAAIRRHDAHLTHMADLGQIDHAIWNTSQGRFVQEIKGEQISTRLSDHVEPIFIPVSLVFWLWDDVRALLIVQAVALALGAWPVFHIAWLRLGLHWGKEQATGRASQPASSTAAYQALASLAFVVAYLLYPPAQAALLADFHALPLATPLILLAFLWSERQQWGRFILAALLVATVQEGMALLTAALGAYALLRGLWRRAGRRWPAPSCWRLGWPGFTWPPSSSFRPTPPSPTAWVKAPTSPASARWATALATWRAP